MSITYGVPNNFFHNKRFSIENLIILVIDF